MIADIWSDLQLALVLFVLVYVVQWAIANTGSRKIGIIIGIVVVYLTIYQHWQLMVLVAVFFFGYAFFVSMESGTTGLGNR